MSHYLDRDKEHARAFAFVLLVWVALTLACRGIDDTPEFLAGRTRARIGIVGNALIQFRQETGRFPTTEEGLQVLMDAQQKTGKLLRVIPDDGWGKQLVYKATEGSKGELFLLYSIGPNGIDDGGSGDDINYWSNEVQKEFKSG
jgi:general secretion pathway protein G